MDVQETAAAYVVSSNLSGFPIHGAQVQVHGNALVVNCGHNFGRRIVFPSNANLDKARAMWDGGLLTVSIPKHPPLPHFKPVPPTTIYKRS